MVSGLSFCFDLVLGVTVLRQYVSVRVSSLCVRGRVCLVVIGKERSVFVFLGLLLIESEPLVSCVFSVCGCVVVLILVDLDNLCAGRFIGRLPFLLCKTPLVLVSSCAPGRRLGDRR